MRKIVIFALFVLLFSACFKTPPSFKSRLPKGTTRPWLGAEYWANPLQDWRLHKGRMECVVSGGDRNVFLLTYRLAETDGAFTMRVRLGKLEPKVKLQVGWAGFRVGIRGRFNDYRDDAIRGSGLNLGVTTRGKLFIAQADTSPVVNPVPLNDLVLEMQAFPEAQGYAVQLKALSSDGHVLQQIEKHGLAADWFTGGVALVCSWKNLPTFDGTRKTLNYGPWGAKPGTERGGNVRFWFKDWTLEGEKVQAFPERAWGPILFNQYTLSKHILKMTVQMAPIAFNDPQTIHLQVQRNGKWKTVARASIDTLSRTATFRLENWPTQQDVRYRLVYGPFNDGVKRRNVYYQGLVRHEPWEKEEISLAAFTGNNDLGFPNRDITRQIEFHDPDLLFFSGDQIYEGVGGYGVQRAPLKQAVLDYLRKWYLWGWAYGFLTKDRPTICIPDDHDYYHGNLWGAGGKPTPPGLSGYLAQDAGGFKMPAKWINMMQHTQTSHLPDPFDPQPVEQGITVYFCNLNYAGLSFAILEDRKFKSPPKQFLPQAQIVNGWAQNRNFNPKNEADVPEAVLLGARQLRFLEHWAADWSDSTWMKVVLSQTIFANVATLPKDEAYSDAVVPRLRILKPGEYPPDDVPVADMDSNGWPPSGRNRALQRMRKAFAFHIAGDQHLGSFIQYGIKQWEDAGFAFCVPAISNVWPRRWCPQFSGKNPRAGFEKYTGQYEDGFGNKITVWAVSNPHYTGLKPSLLYDRATGYGRIRFNRIQRTITAECWPRQANPANGKVEQYAGWPITVKQTDNFFKAAPFSLPEIVVHGLNNAVVQLLKATTNQVVFTIRMAGQRFVPKVYQKGIYRLKVGDPDQNLWQEVNRVTVLKEGEKRQIEIHF